MTPHPQIKPPSAMRGGIGRSISAQNRRDDLRNGIVHIITCCIADRLVREKLGSGQMGKDSIVDAIQCWERATRCSLALLWSGLLALRSLFVIEDVPQRQFVFWRHCRNRI